MLDLHDYRALVQLDTPVDAATGAEPMSNAVRIERILSALRAEGLRLPAAAVPRNDRELLRALLTIRRPGAMSGDMMRDIDALLREEGATRPVVPHASLRQRDAGSRVLVADDICTVWLGDITTLAIDAIVNAGNDQLLGCFVPFHRCIDNAIHDVAGPRLRQACSLIMKRQGHPEPTGQAKITRGYHLPAGYVLHTVGPIVETTPTPTHRADLAGCYRNCLTLASRVGLRSLAFCAISTGLYRYPRVDAARVAVDTVRQWREAHPSVLDHIVFNVFDEASWHAYNEALASS